MRKGDLVKALAPFADDDHIMIGEDASLSVPNIDRICGKIQRAMPYYCCLAPGHDGECFCMCKRVYFTPDQKPEGEAR